MDMLSDDGKQNLSDVVYTLDGRKVAGASVYGESPLQSGIYICKGEKILIE